MDDSVLCMFIESVDRQCPKMILYDKVIGLCFCCFCSAPVSKFMFLRLAVSSSSKRARGASNFNSAILPAMSLIIERDPESSHRNRRAQRTTRRWYIYLYRYMYAEYIYSFLHLIGLFGHEIRSECRDRTWGAPMFTLPRLLFFFFAYFV